MKINDLFEQQQDEGIGSALGKVAGGIGKAVGGAVGGARALGSAAKAGYKAGSAGAQQSILGQTFPDVSLNPNGSTAGQQGGQGQQQTAPAQGNTAPAQPTAAAGGQAPAQGQQSNPSAGWPVKTANGAEFRFNPDTGEEFKTPEEAQAKLDARIKANPNYGKAGGGQQAPADGQQAPADNQQAAAEPAGPAPMKAAEIAGELKGVWDKASADQGSMTSSPQVQQQIIAIAKAAGLAGRKIEGKQFYSKFLGQDI